MLVRNEVEVPFCDVSLEQPFRQQTNGNEQGHQQYIPEGPSGGTVGSEGYEYLV